MLKRFLSTILRQNIKVMPITFNLLKKKVMHRRRKNIFLALLNSFSKFRISIENKGSFLAQFCG